MKTAEEWSGIIQKFLNETGWNPGLGWQVDEAGRLAAMVRQIQADARMLPPPDVPPGVLLEDSVIAAVEKDIEPFKGHTLQLLVSDGGARINRLVPDEDYDLTAAVVRRGPGDYQTDEEWAWCRLAMCGLFTAIQNLPDLLAERSRLIGLLRDLSLDNATERYNAGYAARVHYGEWMPLEDLPRGAIFETHAGVRAVKSEYLYSNTNPDPQCILLASGEYAHFPQGRQEEVREIFVEGVTP